jgi:hypothetical protein
MAIERLSFDDGRPLTSKFSAEVEVADILSKNKDKIEVLPEGEYNLTPASWNDSPIEHDIKVLENGNAIYKQTSRSFDTNIIALDSQGLDYKPGLDIRYMTKNGTGIFIYGPLKYRKSNGVFEILHHVSNSVSGKF